VHCFERIKSDMCLYSTLVSILQSLRYFVIVLFCYKKRFCVTTVMFPWEVRVIGTVRRYVIENRNFLRKKGNRVFTSGFHVKQLQKQLPRQKGTYLKTFCPPLIWRKVTKLVQEELIWIDIIFLQVQFFYPYSKYSHLENVCSSVPVTRILVYTTYSISHIDKFQSVGNSAFDLVLLWYGISLVHKAVLWIRNDFFRIRI
jgi:hypothetical protein